MSFNIITIIDNSMGVRYTRMYLYCKISNKLEKASINYKELKVSLFKNEIRYFDTAIEYFKRKIQKTSGIAMFVNNQVEKLQ